VVQIDYIRPEKKEGTEIGVANYHGRLQATGYRLQVTGNSGRRSSVVSRYPSPPKVLRYELRHFARVVSYPGSRIFQRIYL
jgi:hypothetical protein